MVEAILSGPARVGATTEEDALLALGGGWVTGGNDGAAAAGRSQIEILPVACSCVRGTLSLEVDEDGEATTSFFALLIGAHEEENKRRLERTNLEQGRRQRTQEKGPEDSGFRRRQEGFGCTRNPLTGTTSFYARLSNRHVRFNPPRGGPLLKAYPDRRMISFARGKTPRSRAQRRGLRPMMGCLRCHCNDGYRFVQ